MILLFFVLSIGLLGCGKKAPAIPSNLVVEIVFPPEVAMGTEGNKILRRRMKNLSIVVSSSQGEREFSLPSDSLSGIQIKSEVISKLGRKLHLEAFLWDFQRDGRVRDYPALSGEGRFDMGDEETKKVQVLLKLHVPANEYIEEEKLIAPKPN